MHFFCSGKLALLLTLFTERVGLDVAVTDTLPSTTISLVGSGVTLELVVVFVHCFLVLGTVLLAFCKPTAAGISTGTLWFVWHLVHLPYLSKTISGLKASISFFLPLCNSMHLTPSLLSAAQKSCFDTFSFSLMMSYKVSTLTKPTWSISTIKFV
jgi:hypothetical protein